MDVLEAIQREWTWSEDRVSKEGGAEGHSFHSTWEQINKISALSQHDAP